MASQGNRPAHVTLKALDWVSISCASWHPPKMTQHSQIQGVKQNVCFQMDKSDLSAWRSGDEDSSLGITGLVEWIWRGHVKLELTTEIFMVINDTPVVPWSEVLVDAVAMVLEIINGVNMGYKKSGRGSKSRENIAPLCFKGY